MTIVPTTLENGVVKRSDFVVDITADGGDLSAAVNNTALVLSCLTTLANVMMIELSHVELLEPFQDTTDAAQNSTSLTIGDGGSANRHLTATELNANGAYVTVKAGTGTKYVPGADTPTTFTFTPTAGKNLANLNKGKLRAYFRVIDARPRP